MIIGVGTDITEVKRLKQAVEKWGDAFLTKIFTPKEVAHAKTRGSVMYQHMAGRFAAKEAVYKALGDREVSWKDLEVLNDVHGKPHCTLRRRRHAQKLHIHLSISHVKNYAVACAVVSKEA